MIAGQAVRTILVNHLLEPPQRVTGITRFLFAMLNGLLRNTDDTYVLATSWNRESLPDELRNSRLIVETHKFYRSNSINALMQRLVLPAIVARHGVEIEFNSNPIGGFGVPWPRIMTVHDLYLNLLPEEYSKKTVWVGTHLMALSTHGAAGILVPSASTWQDLAHFYPHLASRAFIIHEAPAHFESDEIPNPLVEGRYGLIVGNISPNKNVGRLIEALAMLRKKGTVIPFVHVGRDENGLIEKHSASMGSVRMIESRQGLSDAALASIYRHATFFINTSLHEGFCLPLLEAQCFGTPVIASNRSALPEVAGDGAIFIDPQSVTDIAAAMDHVWHDPALAQALSQRGLKNAERFSWDKAARELREKIESILAKPQSLGLIAQQHAPSITSPSAPLSETRT